MYRVFQDNIRCNDYNLLGWEKDTFDTKDEAFIYMIQWSFPLSNKEAEGVYYNEKNELSYKNLELGKEYDMSMGEIPVMMKVEFVEVLDEQEIQYYKGN